MRDRSKRFEMRKLQDFLQEHEGVEGYLEPQTATLSLTLLLVARGGEWARGEVSDRGQAAAFCKKVGIPFYDAAVVGYPKRLRGRKRSEAPAAPTVEELEAWFATDPHERD
ncbi:MAG TPA: hypothetical protein VI541_02490 [Actinomycetota bacterium]|nr:hypothetical protein [Actinomycetota bacterium]